MELNDGDQYRKLTSSKIYTLKENDKGLWFLESDSSKGEPLDETFISSILRLKFVRMTEESEELYKERVVSEAYKEDANESFEKGIKYDNFYTIRNKEDQYYNELADIFQETFSPRCMYPIKRAIHYLKIFKKMNIESNIYDVEIKIK